MSEIKTEKLQKVIASLGLASRREAERWIEAGRITINDTVAKLGDRVSENDMIYLDGKLISQQSSKEKTRVLIYNKPIGEICSRSDPKHSNNVFRNLPPLSTGRWIMIGRLDINTCGLLLFTNDGELANQLMHPSHEIEREYASRVLGEIDGLILEKLQKGVELEDGMARFDKIRFVGGEGANTWYHVVIKEGKNREIRRLWESQGIKVSRLLRIRFGNIELPKNLKPGSYKELPEKEIQQLRKRIVG